MRHFFCLLHSHALVMAVYSGQPKGWPLALWTVFLPLFRLPPSRRKDVGKFKTYQREKTMASRSYSAYARTSNNIIEHTPVLDLPTHLALKKKVQTRKKIKDSLAFIAYLIIAYILINLGGAI